MCTIFRSFEFCGFQSSKKFLNLYITWSHGWDFLNIGPDVLTDRFTTWRIYVNILAYCLSLMQHSTVYLFEANYWNVLCCPLWVIFWILNADGHCFHCILLCVSGKTLWANGGPLPWKYFMKSVFCIVGALFIEYTTSGSVQVWILACGFWRIIWLIWPVILLWQVLYFIVFHEMEQHRLTRVTGFLFFVFCFCFLFLKTDQFWYRY